MKEPLLRLAAGRRANPLPNWLKASVGVCLVVDTLSPAWRGLSGRVMIPAGRVLKEGGGIAEGGGGGKGGKREAGGGNRVLETAGRTLYGHPICSRIVDAVYRGRKLLRHGGLGALKAPRGHREQRIAAMRKRFVAVRGVNLSLAISSQ